MTLDVLLRTKCGSHAWGMERPDSDTDWFTMYRTPTRDILRSATGTDDPSKNDRTLLLASLDGMYAEPTADEMRAKTKAGAAKYRK